MFKFGLIKDEGQWNTPSTKIYYNHNFDGYKPSQSDGVFGLISSTDGNFWLMGEDDDYYWTKAKISEETVRYIHNVLVTNDFSNENIFSFNGNLLNISLMNLQDNKKSFIQFDKTWIPSLIKVLDIDNPILTTQEILPVWEKSIVPDRVSYPLMTPEEYVYFKIQEYPILYADNDFEVSKFKVYNQVFNVLGNGISSFDEFQEELSKKQEINIKNIQQTIKENAENNNKFLQIMQKLYKNKDEIVISTKFQPYQNFQKEYSILWTTPEILSLLSDEWKKEIIWFYTKSIESINDGCFKYYMEFPTGSIKEDAKRIEEMNKYISGKTHKYVSEQYGFGATFNGDIVDLLTKRWIITKQNYMNFIDETIQLLTK